MKADEYGNLKYSHNKGFMRMTSKRNIMIPKPQSNFISVQCRGCGEKRIMFTHTTTDINCNSCGQPLAKKAGAKANVLGEVQNILD